MNGFAPGDKGSTEGCQRGEQGCTKHRTRPKQRAEVSGYLDETSVLRSLACQDPHVLTPAGCVGRAALPPSLAEHLLGLGFVVSWGFFSFG